MEPASSHLSELIEALREVRSAPLARRLAVADGLNDATRRRGLEITPETSTWLTEVQLEALQSPAEVDAALLALRNLHSEAKLAPLSRLALDATADVKRRTAALDAVFDCEGGPALAAQVLAHGDPVPLCRRAAELLGQRGSAAKGGAEAIAALLGALQQAPWELAGSIAGALARTDAGAAALLTSLESGAGAPALLRLNAVSGPLLSRSAALRERAAKLTADLLPENARLDAEIAERAKLWRAAMAGPMEQRPDSTRGREVFLRSCAACHKVKSQGGNVGPNLDGVSARGVERLMEDILDPNRNVDPAFRQTIVGTADGRTLMGVRPRRSGELLVLSDMEGKELSIPAAQVKSQATSPLSLMPPMFEQTLSEAELNDLAAFLLPTP